MERFWDELRVTIRTLAKARGFTIAVIATLGIGLALETTIVSIVNAYLVRSLPYPAARRLYQVAYSKPGERAPRDMETLNWASLSDVVEHPIAWDLDVFYLVDGDDPESAPGAWVTPGFMDGLGIRPAIGRAFVAEEFQPGGPQAALISHELWQKRFAGDPKVLGRRFRAYVSDRPRDPEVFTIVGVLPANFWHLNPYTQVITPLRAATYPYMVRLRENVPPVDAERRISALVRLANPRLQAEWHVELKSTHAEYAKSIRPLLVALGSAVTLVLLIACSNVTLLMLLRGIRRQKEIAVRLALGASKGQVARLLVAESLLLSSVAAGAGVTLGRFVLEWLAPTIERQLGRRVPGGSTALSVDLTVVSAVVVLALLIAAAMSLIPIVVTNRRSLFAAMRIGRQTGVDGARGTSVRSLLITLEVAGSFALLVGCGLMVRTVRQMLDVDLGIHPARVVATPVALREQTYRDVESRSAFYERLLGAVAQAPGAELASLSSPSPLSSFDAQPVRVNGSAMGSHRAAVRAVTAGYFDVLGISILQGRPFSASDKGSSEPVVVISETLARTLWPNSTPIGQRVRVVERSPTTGDTMSVMRTIVGVTRDVRQSPTDDQLSDVYIPLLQVPARFAVIVVRATETPMAWAATLRRTVKTIDREAALNASQDLAALVEDQLARPRFLASLFAGFGFFASALGIMGLYAVIAYAVKQREHEIAVRMAVGADGRNIVALFLRDAGVMLAAGIAAGVVGAIGIGRLLTTQLFGVGTVDGATLVTAAIALGIACMTAVWWPSRRAARIDPVIALKSE